MYRPYVRPSLSEKSYRMWVDFADNKWKAGSTVRLLQEYDTGPFCTGRWHKYYEGTVKEKGVNHGYLVDITCFYEWNNDKLQPPRELLNKKIAFHARHSLVIKLPSKFQIRKRALVRLLKSKTLCQNKKR